MNSPCAHWSESLPWRCPVSKRRMEMIVASRHPSGRALTGALRVAGTSTGYPIVYGIPRITVELAHRYKNWLIEMGLQPPAKDDMQPVSTVESFGFQWMWDSCPRSEDDLRWRIAERHGLTSSDFAEKTVLDAGCGAGDQSAWLLDKGHPRRLVSLDLSEAVTVAYKKLEDNPTWLGIQGDISSLCFDDAVFELIYCEGVIQHTRDSQVTVTELVRVLRDKGLLVTTHYSLPRSMKDRFVHRLRTHLRSKLSKLDRYHLLFLSGLFAGVSRIPVVGWIAGRTIAVVNPRMGTFKAAWSCTYDNYGFHNFQRYISAPEFMDYFLKSGFEVSVVRRSGTDLVIRKDSECGLCKTGPEYGRDLKCAG